METKIKKHAKRRPKKKVELYTDWGNQDIDSSIRMPLSKWNKILEGMECSQGAYSWYEGRRTHVTWKFNKSLMGSCKGRFSITSDEQDYVDSECLEAIDVFYYE